MWRVTRFVFLIGLVAAAAGAGLACDTTRPSCTYVLSRTSVALPPAGGSEAISVTASAGSCAWAASATAPWLTVTPASGTGNGAVSVTATANGLTARSGALTIAGQTVTVTQDGLPPPTYTLSGRVTDAFMSGASSDFGLSGVTVTVAGPSPRSATTDFRGDYAVADLLAGTYTVGFAKPAYLPSTTTLAMSGATTLLVNLALNVPSPPSTSNLTGYWSGIGTYPNAPFKLALVQNGTTFSGAYRDQHDASLSVSGTFSTASFTLRVDFGDAVLYLECTVDGARQVSGVQRTSALGNRPYPFTMTR